MTSQYIPLLLLASGWGAIGKAITSNTRDLQLEFFEKS